MRFQAHSPTTHSVSVASDGSAWCKKLTLNLLDQKMTEYRRVGSLRRRQYARYCASLSPSGAGLPWAVEDLWAASIRNLASAIQARRTSCGMSQAELARRAKVSLRRIQQLEAEYETSNPSLRILTQIAHALGSDVPNLLRNQDMTPERRSKKNTSK